MHGFATAEERAFFRWGVSLGEGKSLAVARRLDLFWRWLLVRNWSAKEARSMCHRRPSRCLLRPDRACAHLRPCFLALS